MGSDPQYAKYPNLSLAQDIFTLTNVSSSPPSRQISLKKLQDVISEQKMAPLYRYLAHPTDGCLNTTGESSTRKASFSSSRRPPTSSIISGRRPSTDVDFPWDEELYEKLKADNEAELETFEKEEEEAAEKAGETEVQAARGKRAEFWSRIGEKVQISSPPDHSSGCSISLTVPYGDRIKQYPPMSPSLRKPASWAPGSTLFSPSSAQESSSTTNCW